MLLDVNQVMEMLNVEKGRAYSIIRELNKELKKQGFRTLNGRIEEKYLKERFRILA